jgi:hypothetical protein
MKGFPLKQKSNEWSYCVCQSENDNEWKVSAKVKTRKSVRVAEGLEKKRKIMKIKMLAFYMDVVRRKMITRPFWLVIHSCLGDVVYDRYETAKIKWWVSRALLLGALLYFVASRYR